MLAAPLPQALPAAEGEDDDELKLGDVLALLQRRSRLALAVGGLILALGGALTARERLVNPLYRGGFQLLLSDPINEGLQGRESALQSLAIRDAGSVNSNLLMQVLRSTMLLKPVAERLEIDARTLASRITLANSDENNPGVLSVTLLWPDPEQGQQVLEALADDYLNYSVRQRQQKLVTGMAFLDQQAPVLQRNVDKIEDELAAFRRRYAIVDPTTDAVEVQRQRSEVQANLQGLIQEQVKLENQLRAVRAGQLPVRGQQAAEPPAETGPKGISERQAAGVAPSAMGKLAAVEDELATALATYRPDSPLVANLQARRDQMRRLLQQQAAEELGVQLGDLAEQRRALEAEDARLAAHFSRDPALIRQYDAIQQRLDVAQSNIKGYVQAKENFRLEDSQRRVPWQVLTPPVFGTMPVKPEIGRSLLVWALLGTVGGLAAAVVRDRLDHVFHSSRELEDALEQPLLGSIPHLPVASGQTVVEALAELPAEHRFAMREALRNLFATFRLLRAGKALRLLLITSTSQAEGKSTAASLFAQTLADLGQRVLLVDADLRRPRLHSYLGYDNLAGVSNLLTDPEPPTLEAVQALIQRGGEGLDVLSAGDTPPDAAKLLSSPRCRELCEVIRALPGYDVVLFDSPPALELADPVLLSEHLDGLLFLVSIQRIDRSLPQLALRRIQSSGVDMLGVVANHVVTPASGRSAYGYGGYGGYGYGGYGYGGYGYGGANYNRYLMASENGTSSPATKLQRRLQKGFKSVLGWLDRRS